MGSQLTLNTLRRKLVNVQAGKYDGLKGNETLAAVRHDFPKLDVKKPTFFSGSNDVVSSNVAAVQLGLTGMSFSACAVPISPVGVNVGPTVSAVPSSGISLFFMCHSSLSKCIPVAYWCFVKVGNMLLEA